MTMSATILRAAATRVTLLPDGDVLVERRQPSGRWRLRRYRKDGNGFIAEVRPNGSCFPVGLGLRTSLSPIWVDGSLRDAILVELAREPVSHGCTA